MIAATLMVKIAAETTAFHKGMADAQRAVKNSATQMQQGSAAVSALQNRIRLLNESFRLGRIAENQWAEGMRTAVADARSLAATTELTNKSTERLTRSITGAEGALRRQAMMSRRSADGIERGAEVMNALTIAATGGASGIAMAANQLQRMAVAAGAVKAVGIIGALGAIATLAATVAMAFGSMKSKTQEAMNALADFSRLRLAAAGLTPAQTQENLAEEIRIREQALARMQSLGPVGVGGAGGAAAVLSAAAQAMTVRLAARGQREAVEEELANLRVIQTINNGRLSTQRDITASINKANAAFEDQDTVLARIVDKLSKAGGAIRSMATPFGPTPEFIASVEQRKAVARQAAALGSQAITQGVGMAMGSDRAPISAMVKADLAVLESLKPPVVNLTNSIVGAVTNMASSIGTALAQGANLFKAFADSAIASIGSLIQAIGQMLIAKGIGDIVKALPFAGPAAIAAGVGLVALGAAMGGGGQSGRGAAPQSVRGSSGSTSTGTQGPQGSTQTVGQPQGLTVQFVMQGSGAVAREVHVNTQREAALGGIRRVSIPVEGLVTSRG